MTNYFENLDAILTIYRMNYLSAYAKEDFISASQFLFDRNSAHPPDAWLEEMKRFVMRSDSLRSRLDLNQKGKRYCDYWNPRLEIAMAQFRQDNQTAYNQI